MQFKDRGLILTKKPLKEKDYIIDVFSQQHGVYSGVLKQYSKKNGDNLTPGNLVEFSWYSRLEEHIGTIRAENIKSYSNQLMFDQLKLYSFHSLISLLKLSFRERERHDQLFLSLLNFMESLKNNFQIKNYLNFELAILKEAGYQLNLQQCVVSGSMTDLCFVSPKSGQAVSRHAGRAYQAKLLPLPEFLVSQIEPNLEQIRQGFILTSYFFEKYIFNDKPMPIARSLFIELVTKCKT